MEIRITMNVATLKVSL